MTDIYLCGHSQGGLTVFLAAGLKHELIKGVIALSPAAMIPDLARNGELLDSQFDPVNVPDEITFWGDKVIGDNYIRVAQMIRVEDYIDRYDGPVLIVQGSDDFPELKRSSKAAADRYAHSEYVEIEGDTHTYDNHADMMTEAIKKWLR